MIAQTVSLNRVRKPVKIRDRLLRLLAYGIVTHHTVGVLILVLSDDRRRMLLVQQNLRQRGAWGMPGGFARKGERPEVTATRELFEEAGRVQTDMLLLDVYRQSWARHYEIVFHTTAPTSAPVLKASTAPTRHSDAGGARWFDIDQLPRPLTVETEFALDQLRQTRRMP